MNKYSHRAEKPKLVCDITRSQRGLILRAKKIKHMLGATALQDDEASHSLYSKFNYKVKEKQQLILLLLKSNIFYMLT